MVLLGEFREESGRFLKKAAQKLLSLWVFVTLGLRQ
jgi:hypothetical protein